MTQKNPQTEAAEVTTTNKNIRLADAVASPLWVGVALLLAGSGLTGTLLGVRAQIEAFPTAVIGMVMSAYYLGYLAGSQFIPKIIHLVGHIRTFAALAALASVTIGLHSIFVTPTAWASLRILTGFCFAGLYVVIESWLNARAGNANRGFLLSAYMVVSLASLVLGQQMLNLYSPEGHELFTLASIAISLSLIPFALTRKVAPDAPPSARFDLRGMLAISPLGVGGCFAVGLANGAFWGMAPVFGRQIGLSVGHISLFMSAVILGGLVMQLPIGRLSDKFDRRKVLVVTCCLNAASAVAIFLFSYGTENILLLLGFVFGGFALTLYSLCVAHADDFLEEGDLVEASSSLLFAFGAGALFGPVLASFSMAAVGPEGLFLYIAVVSGGLAIYAGYHVIMIPPMQRQAKFVLVPETTPGVHQLDPRTGVSPSQVNNGRASTAQ